MSASTIFKNAGRQEEEVRFSGWSPRENSKKLKIFDCLVNGLYFVYRRNHAV